MLKRQHVELVAEGLDTFARLVLNGREIGRNDNMFLGRRFDVRKNLRAGKNVLEIFFESPLSQIRKLKTPDHFQEWCDPVGGASLVRKEQCSFGWDWGPRFPTSGVWLPIRLESWDTNRIESVRVVQTHGRAGVRLAFTPALAAKGKGRFRGRVTFHGKKVARVRGPRDRDQGAALWWPNGTATSRFTTSSWNCSTPPAT